jgi:hypothetical protein
MIQIDRIISYEQGDLSDLETVELFSELIRDGSAWTLQGHYGRTASGLISQGVIDTEGNIDYDYLDELIERAQYA